LIEATDRQELQHSLKQLAGGITQPLQEVREDLLNLLADVEAGLDFAEEDIHFVSPDALLRRLGKALAYLLLLQKQITQRSLAQKPFRVVLAGPANAGKSSLFNALAGADSALVSPLAGTTRDYLEATIELDGIPVVLVDTAGEQQTRDVPLASAQSLGREQARQADLILWCEPSDSPTEPPPPIQCWRIATKADLAPPVEDVLSTSSVTGAGLDVLLEQLSRHVRHSGRAALAPSLSRCRHHVETCMQQLRRAHSIVLSQEMPELLALELRLAVDELGAMAGVVYTDDLLDRIFSRFCIGK
jgi:tRNA modification GTPase